MLEAGVHCSRGKNVMSEGMVMERVGQEGGHCQENVVVRNPGPRLPSHPVYGTEKSYIRVLDIQIGGSESRHTDNNSDNNQKDNTVSGQAQPYQSGAGVSFSVYTNVLLFITLGVILL